MDFISPAHPRLPSVPGGSGTTETRLCSEGRVLVRLLSVSQHLCFSFLKSIFSQPSFFIYLESPKVIAMALSLLCRIFAVLSHPLSWHPGLFHEHLILQIPQVFIKGLLSPKLWKLSLAFFLYMIKRSRTCMDVGVKRCMVQVQYWCLFCKPTNCFLRLSC